MCNYCDGAAKCQTFRWQKNMKLIDKLLNSSQQPDYRMTKKSASGKCFSSPLSE